MANNVAETLVGAAVLIVAGGFLAYASQNADFGSGSNYNLQAKFFSADGVAPGIDVRMSGVKIGSVGELSLDKKTFEAVVSLNIANGIEVPSDTSAKISSDGLLGGSFISLEPGGSEYPLEPGEEIERTQGSVSLIDLLGKAVHSATQ